MRPFWSGWTSVAAAAQLPNEQAILGWLGNLVADPTLALETVRVFAEQTLASAEEMDVLFTLATTLLAAASIAGLVQLLSGERPLTATAEARV